MKRVRKLFLGHTESVSKLRPAIKNQVYTVLRIWRNYGHDDIGIERLIRLFLSLSQFLSPGLYVKHFAGRWGVQLRKLATEAYVLLKLSFPVWVFRMDLEAENWVAWIACYMLFETVVYLASMVFLADVSREHVAPKRSLTLLFINFFEIVFEFGLLYAYLDSTQLHPFNQPITSGKDAVYFSFVTAATVGYGDIVPVSNMARAMAVTQITLTFVFVGLFLNYFSSMLQRFTKFDPSYRPFRKTRHGKGSE